MWGLALVLFVRCCGCECLLTGRGWCDCACRHHTGESQLVVRAQALDNREEVFYVAFRRGVSMLSCTVEAIALLMPHMHSGISRACAWLHLSVLDCVVCCLQVPLNWGRQRCSRTGAYY